MSISVWSNHETPEKACWVFNIVTISDVISTFALSIFPALIFPKEPFIGIPNVGNPDLLLFWKRLFPTGVSPGPFTKEANAKLPITTSSSSPYVEERGITILAKNTGLSWNDYRINVVDTPGHADFGGEVERVLSMVDAVLLVVDAAEGPMPQTRFVTQKAFNQGLKPIVIVNKVDKVGADPHGAIDKVFDLFDQLGATDDQLDFPVVYCSAINGLSGPEPDQLTESMEPILQAIVDHCPAPEVDLDGPLQLQISALDYNSFQGVIGVGRIRRGQLKRNQQV